MFKAMHKRIKESLFHKAMTAIKQKPKLFLYMFLLDLGFLGVFYVLNLLLNTIIPTDPAFMTKLQADNLLLIAVIVLIVIYIVVMVLAYSFFSLIVLGNIKKLSTEHKHDFSMLKSMFGLNLLLFVLFFLLLTIFNIALGLLINKSVWIAIMFGIIVFVVALLAYAFYNFTHSALILGHEFKDNLKHSIKHVFTRSYLGIYLFSFIVIVLYMLLYFIIGLIFKNEILANYEPFVTVSSIVTLVLVYLLFSFNRIYFFFVAEKHIGHKK